MSAKTLNRLLVSTAAPRLVRVLALVLPLAALAAGGDAEAARKKAVADEGLRDAFERVVRLLGDHNSQHQATAEPTWTQQQELLGPEGTTYAAEYAQFGWSVAVAADTAVIGAPGQSAGPHPTQGAAYVFVRSGGVWTLQQELAASDGSPGDQFGYSVSVDGDTAVIGAPSKIIGSQTEQGAAYMFVRSGTSWTQQQELPVPKSSQWESNGFGMFVSVSGDTAVIEAWGEGAAYVFVRSSTVWAEQQELTASDGMSLCGPVSVSGNTALIAACGNDYQGAAYVYVQSGTAWSQQQELTASDGAAYDAFGSSVSVAGDMAVIGASGKNGNKGAAYVLVRSGGVWSQQQELVDPGGEAWDQFGQSVSVSGNTAVIGAIAVAYVFAQNGAVWSQQQELFAPEGPEDEDFGAAVSVSGGTAVIGDIGVGAAYVFTGSAGTTGTQPTITGVGVSGGGSNIAQNAWVSIYGSNLAPASVGTGVTWSSAPSFASGQMPTQLQGVSVTVNGKPAYIYYVSAAQINVLTPLDSTTGSVAVEANNGTTTSAAFDANLQAAAPGFLRFGDGVHIAALHANYGYLGPTSMSVSGYTFTPATPGETILLFGDGFGLPVSTLTAGSDVQTGALPTPWPQVTIGGITATVQYAGLISPGLYQINVVVPSNAANGDNQVIATYGGASSPTGAMIPVSQ